tara:strand:+ start:1335 stop:1598 length:264 start_codon:yes stop_codon:yes gene_type:complete
MYKFINILMFLIILIFFFNVLNYYSSNKNIETKNFNRLNIDKILKEKISNLKILDNDTNNVIEFNNSLKNQTNDEKKRSFWELFKKQ